MINNLSQYFLNPASLDEIGATEIENQIDLAPYASPFRMLLAKKKSDFKESQLMLLNNDRVWMHYLIHSDKIIPSIHDYETLENSKSNFLNSEQQIPNMVKNVDLDEGLNTYLEEGTTEVFEEQNVIQEIPFVSITSKTDETEISKQPALKGSSKVKKKKVKKFKLNEYRGITEFSKWLLSFKNDDIEKKIKKEEKAARKRAFDESAKKSVTKSANIISEPLAEILASQGHLDDAKKMYEQLIVKYPEKSSYFAAKIDTLIKT